MEQRKNLSLNDAVGITSRLLLNTIHFSPGELTLEQREKYKFDPVGFSRDILGGDPWQKQQEIMESVANNERTTVRSANSVGKTWAAASLVLWFASCFVPSTVVTTATVSRQVRDILWKEIKTQYSNSRVDLGGRMLTMNWELSKEVKWFATGFTIKETNLDRFQGYHNDNVLIVVDEACGVEAPIYSAIEGILASGQIVRLLLIGNPNNEATEFGKSFKSSLYKKFNLSVFDSPNFTEFNITEEDMRKNTWADKITTKMPRLYLANPSWAAGRHEVWGEDNPFYQVRVNGNFPREDPDKFIPMHWIERAHDLDFTPEGVKVLGVDVAGLGRDESVATLRWGNVQCNQRVWTKKNPMENAGIIINLIREWTPDVVNIDSIGEGAGTVARLKELKWEVNGINVQERASKPDEFINKRAEYYSLLRNKLRDSTLKLIQDDIQDNELLNTEALPISSRGQQRIEPKENIKKKIGKSPDRADALMLTMYEKNEELVIVEDLSSAFTEGDNEIDFLLTSDIEKALAPLGDQVHRMEHIEYNEISDYMKCPECGYSEGVILLDEFGVASKDNATRMKCIICHLEKEV